MPSPPPAVRRGVAGAHFAEWASLVAGHGDEPGLEGDVDERRFCSATRSRPPTISRRLKRCGLDTVAHWRSRQMRALTWHGPRDVRVQDVPDPLEYKNPPMPSCASPRRPSAARISTCTRCSDRSLTPATSSGMSRWALSRRLLCHRLHVSPRRSRRRPVQYRLRQLLHVRAWSVRAVRDHSGA